MGFGERRETHEKDQVCPLKQAFHIDFSRRDKLLCFALLCYHLYRIVLSNWLNHQCPSTLGNARKAPSVTKPSRKEFYNTKIYFRDLLQACPSLTCSNHPTRRSITWCLQNHSPHMLNTSNTSICEEAGNLTIFQFIHSILFYSTLYRKSGSSWIYKFPHMELR